MNPIDDLLARFSVGERCDWGGATVDGALLSNTIRQIASNPAGARILLLVNASVRGDVVLHGLEAIGNQLTLQVVQCKFQGGLSAAASVWRELSVLGSELRHINIPSCRSDLDITIEQSRCGRLDARKSRVGGAVNLNLSRFGPSGSFAIDFSDARIEMGFSTRNSDVVGGLSISNAKIAGRCSLDGSSLVGTEPTGRALDAFDARVDGDLRLVSAAHRPFSASGTIYLIGAKIGALIIRAARLDGQGECAILADHLEVRHTVDIGGAGENLELIGGCRFVAARVGGQIQVTRAHFDARGGEALSFDGAFIEGDLVLGYIGTERIRFAGRLSVENAQIEGRAIFNSLDLESGNIALNLRSSTIRGGVAIYDSNAAGQILMGNLRAAGFEGVNLNLVHKSDQTALIAENYSSSDSVCIDLSFAQIDSDLLLENVRLQGGCIRLIGATVGGGLQAIGLDATDFADALVGQNARVSKSFHIAGTDKTPSRLSNVHLMGLRVDGDFTFDNVAIGMMAEEASLVLRGMSVAGNVMMHKVHIHGQLNLSAAEIGNDLSLMIGSYRSATASSVDARHLHVENGVQLGATGEVGETVMGGLVDFDGARFGSLSWAELSLLDEAKLNITHVRVERVLKAARLKVLSGSATIDLTGTDVFQLTDALGEESDGWGGPPMASWYWTIFGTNG